MPHNAPILIIEDDIDDLDILKYTFSDLKIYNEILWLQDPEDVINYLKNTAVKPFLIFCDVNMPKVNGIMLKRRLDDDPVLRKKSIPFIFYSTSIDPIIIDKAYSELTVQGFFKKGHDTATIYNTVKVIMDYWTLCVHPGSGGAGTTLP